MAEISWNWDAIKFYCANPAHDGEKPLMEPNVTGHGIAYQCPKCANCASQYEYEQARSHLASELGKAAKNYTILNLKNHRWTNKRGFNFKVRVYDAPENIEVEVLNEPALRQSGDLS